MRDKSYYQNLYAFNVEIDTTPYFKIQNPGKEIRHILKDSQVEEIYKTMDHKSCTLLKNANSHAD